MATKKQFLANIDNQIADIDSAIDRNRTIIGQLESNKNTLIKTRKDASKLPDDPNPQAPPKVKKTVMKD